MAFINLFSNDLAIDLGSAYIIVYRKDKGIILEEASQVAIDINSGEIVAIGNKAYEMAGKLPENITIFNPLENGTISNFDFAKVLIKFCMDQANDTFSFIQPRVVVTASAGISDIELRALEDAFIYAGAREIYILESSIAGLLGAGFDVLSPEGRMIVDFGDGDTDISIISSGGIVISKNNNISGSLLDNNIKDFIFEKYSLVIGENTARDLKERLGSVVVNGNLSLEISGRDAFSGMPIAIDIFESDIREAIIREIEKLSNDIREVIEKIPPELSGDILKNGIFLTGGGSMILGIDKFIEDRLKIKTVLSENPLTDTVNGAGIVLNDLEKYKKFGR